MTISYPSSLPAPQTLDLHPFERRVLSSIATGPEEARGRSRDFGAALPLTWVFTRDQLAAFMAWGDGTGIGTLERWTRWFSVTLPGRSGFATRVCRFFARPKWDLVSFGVEAGLYRVTAQVEQRGLGVLPSVFDCELLLHFENSVPASWADSSPRNHALSIVSNSGSVASEPSGEFGMGARFTQLAPGDRSTTYYNTQAHIFAAGDIPFGSDEFFISCWVDMDHGSPGIGQGFTLLNSYIGHAGGYNGWDFSVNNAIGTQALSFTMYGSGFPSGVIGVSGGAVPTNQRAHLAASRKGIGGGNDVVSLYIGGTRVAQSAAFPSSAAYSGSAAAGTSIGCQDFSTDGSVRSLVQGFQGMLDEVFAIKGPGTGISDASFTVPIYPYGPDHPWPPA